MTHRAAGPSRGIPRIWLLPLLVFTVILGLTALDYLSRALILDLVAWWPVWLLLAILVVLAGGRRIGRVRVSGLVPILVTGVFVAFVVSHVNEWSLNPSASRYLAGPPVGGFSEAALVAGIDGDIVVEAGSDFLYEVDPLPGGGDVGVPISEERAAEESVVVELDAPSNPGFDSFSGWRISLSESPTWELNLRGILDLDLTSLRIAELEIAGAGDVTLGAADTPVAVTVDGAFNLAVPVGVPVRVAGSAQPPDTWEETSDGWRSPVAGAGWVITVPEGSAIVVEER